MNRISTWKPRTDLVETTENESLKKSLRECRKKNSLIKSELSVFKTNNEELKRLLRECRGREGNTLLRPPAYNPEIPVVFAEPVERGASKKKTKSKPTKKKRKRKKYTKKPKRKKN